MRIVYTFAICFSIACLGAGCSEKTQQEAKEAAQQTGEAVKSAAEDAAENTEKVAEEIGDAIKGSDAETPSE